MRPNTASIAAPMATHVTSVVALVRDRFRSGQFGIAISA